MVLNGSPFGYGANGANGANGPNFKGLNKV